MVFVVFMPSFQMISMTFPLGPTKPPRPDWTASGFTRKLTSISGTGSVRTIQSAKSAEHDNSLKRRSTHLVRILASTSAASSGINLRNLASILENGFMCASIASIACAEARRAIFTNDLLAVLVGWFAGLLVCWFAGLLACWFAGLLVCWLAGLLACLLFWLAGFVAKNVIMLVVVMMVIMVIMVATVGIVMSSNGVGMCCCFGLKT